MSGEDPGPHETLGETAFVDAAWADATSEPAASQPTPLVVHDMARDLDPGRRLGRYVIVKKIGRGGMGTVYAAYDPELDRNLALKLVGASSDGPGGTGGRARLLREAQAIASLSHPNVVAVHDVGVWEDRVVIAMEFIDGISLRTWLHTPRRWREVLDVFLAAAHGLAAAHAAGLVHRDFKPDNVLVGRDGRVRVADFGLARSARPEPELATAPRFRGAADETDVEVGLTRTGMTMGTPAYMSPEQHRGRVVDARSDQFSFCVALWEGLYGRRPFSGKTLPELARQVAARDISVAPGPRRVPSGLRRALLRGLSPVPADRFPDLGALIAALERPAKRQRRWPLWAGGVALSPLAALALFPPVAPAEQPRCEAGRFAATLDGVWDDDARARVEEAILATGKPYAADTWARVESALDAYSDELVAARIAACEAVHVRREQPLSWLDEQVACLDERNEQLQGLVERLAAANDEVLLVAGARVRELPPADGCLTSERDETDRPWPEQPELRSVIAAERIRLDNARDLAQAKNAEGARTIVRSVLRRAQDLRYLPLQAEALVVLAPLEESLDHEAVRAAERLHEAARLALAGRHERVAVEAWVELVRNAAGRRELAEANRWADYCRSLLAHRPEPGLEQRLESALTWLGIAADDNPSALAHAQRGLALVEQHFGPEHPRVIGALNDVSLAHYFGFRKDEALRVLQRALAIAERIHGPEHPALTAPLNNIGVILTDQGHYDAAATHYQRSLAIREATLDERHPNLFQAHDNLAEVLTRDAQWSRARLSAERAVELAVSTDAGPAATIKALHRLGRVELELGLVGSAIRHVEDAIARHGALAPAERSQPEEAHLRFTLARAQWNGREDRRAARGLARRCLAELEAGGESWAAVAREVRAWLATRP